MSGKTKIITGGMGVEPPPGAPREVTQPLSDQAVAEQLARAQANERALAPLTFAPAPAGVVTSSVKPVDKPIRKVPRREGPDVGRPAVEAATVESVAQPEAAGPIILTDAGVGQVGADGDVEILSAPIAGTGDDETPTLTPEQQAQIDAVANAVIQPPAPYQPAASDTDSPSRGIPRAIGDPGKQITGGFGDVGEAQYFPLDGLELRELVLSLMDSLVQQLQNDLRFSIAVCYPRVTARVVVEVDGYAEDQGFTIPRMAVPHDKTPIEIARRLGDQVCFAVIAQRQEMTPDGESISPPNAVRLELGLTIPRKQAIDTPTGRAIVDVAT